MENHLKAPSSMARVRSGLRSCKLSLNAFNRSYDFDLDFKGGSKLNKYWIYLTVPNLLVADEVVIRVRVKYLGRLCNVTVVIDVDALEDNVRVWDDPDEGLELFSSDRIGRRRVGRYRRGRGVS